MVCLNPESTLVVAAVERRGACAAHAAAICRRVSGHTHTASGADWTHPSAASSILWASPASADLPPEYGREDLAGSCQDDEARLCVHLVYLGLTKSLQVSLCSFRVSLISQWVSRCIGQAAVLRRAHARRVTKLEAAATRARAAAAASEVLVAEAENTAAQTVAALQLRAEKAEVAIAAAESASRCAEARCEQMQQWRAEAVAARERAEKKAADLAAQVDLMAVQVTELSGRMPMQLMRRFEAELDEVQQGAAVRVRELQAALGVERRRNSDLRMQLQQQQLCNSQERE